ncbi:MAG: chromosomal replication initiator protein DnaA [Patescibacteria group bacterium]|nr:MAG: chromosomal replication initiator protein DnaA [Patescibacteria group bacterium]
MQVIEVQENQIKEIWARACAQLEIQLSSAVFNTWIAANPLTKLEYGEENTCLATISSPTAFHSTNLKKNLHIPIKQVLDKITGKNCDIQYIVGSTSPNIPQQGFSTIRSSIQPELQQTELSVNQTVNSVFNQSFSTDKQTNSTQSPRVEDLFSQNNLISASEDRVQAISKRIGLRTDFTFQTYAVSPTNEMAHAAARAVSDRPGVAYNPLFLYGGVGVGKTHLMHAIGNNILRSNQDAKILYCTGEEFTNEIVQAIQRKQTGGFKSKYRNTNVLLIDDIQFIAGKEAVQEEFFHTFNALTQMQSQIVLTSDRPPRDMTLLVDRLRSRFEAGLMIDIGQPSDELRAAILLVKARAANLLIPTDLARIIVSKVDSARKIEGVIKSIRSEVELKGKPISPELIAQILASETPEKKSLLRVSPSDVIKTVADHYKLKQTALKGQRRVKSLVIARHIAMFLLKNELDLPLVEIGRWFSGRDHTSVLHAVKKIEKDLATDEIIRRDIANIRLTLTAASK